MCIVNKSHICPIVIVSPDYNDSNQLFHSLCTIPSHYAIKQMVQDKITQSDRIHAALVWPWFT